MKKSFFLAIAVVIAISVLVILERLNQDPMAHIHPSERHHIAFRVGDVHFSVPQYYLESWGFKGEAAKLRNVYYGKCIKRIDGRCGGHGNSSDSEYSAFDVYLENPEPNTDMQQYITENNKKFMNECYSPEFLAARSKISVERSVVKYGKSCPLWFAYRGLVVKMTFNSGNFPREAAEEMIEHVTDFLDTYRTTSSTGEAS